jgi:hypothetical protein
LSLLGYVMDRCRFVYRLLGTGLLGIVAPSLAVRADAAVIAFGTSLTIAGSNDLRDVTNIGYWTGRGAHGSSWDRSTNANLATNLCNSALATTTFNTAKTALSGVTSAAAYWNSIGATAVANNNVAHFILPG